MNFHSRKVVRWKQPKYSPTDPKINVAYTYNGLLYNNMKLNIWTYTTIWMNSENITLIKKPVTKDHTQYDSIYMKCPEEAHDTDRKYERLAAA